MDMAPILTTTGTMCCDVRVSGHEEDFLGERMFEWVDELERLGQYSTRYTDPRVSGSPRKGWVRFRADTSAAPQHLNGAVMRFLGDIRTVLHLQDIATPGWPEDGDAEADAEDAPSKMAARVVKIVVSLPDDEA